jgi:hypothetical protein
MATFTVTTTNDSGAGSLRQAVLDANAAAGADDIVFAAGLGGQTITLTTGELELTGELTIDGDVNGDNKADITISGNNASRIFSVESGANADVLSLTLTNGFVDASQGAGIYARSGSTLDIADTTIRNCTIFAEFPGDQANGGGIASRGTLTVTNSTITGNSGQTGGGVYTTGDATFVNATISGNIAQDIQGTGGFGGGIEANGGTLTVLNSTVTGNTASYDGGGISLAGATATLTNSVVAANIAIASPDDITGPGLTARNSFFGTNVTIDTDLGGNINNGGDPGLGALQDNGGTVQTHNINPGSQLLNAGDSAAPGLPATDANGGDRKVGAAVDIGATEFQFRVTTAADEAFGGGSLAAETADGGGLSLREALGLANANADADRIGFAASLAGQTLVLTGGQLSINNDVAIDGDTNGDDKADITISGNSASRIFNIVTATTDVDLLSLTLTNGRGGDGGAVRANGISSLDIVDTTIMNSVSTNRGGGLFANYATLTMTNSLVAGNTAAIFGGGSYLRVTTATLTNSTIHGNAAADSGGGISTNYSTLNLNNSTITANRADSDGNGSGVGGGIEIFGATVNAVNSVVGDNLVGTGAVEGDVSGTLALATNSVFGTATTITTNNGSQTGVADLGLGALLDNGGTVLTRSALDGSVLIGFGSSGGLPLDVSDIDNDGDTAEPLPQDGRGGLRIVGGTVDAGAVEQIVDETIGGTAGADTILGGLGNDILRGRGGDDTLDGGGGNNDTVDYSEATDAVAVDLSLGGAQLISASQGSDTILNVENITGTGLADTLTGNGQSNRLDGRAGIDTMAGGAGADFYVVDTQSDILIEAAGPDADTVLTTLANYSLFAIANVERITFTGSGNFVGRGNGLDNRILGGLGNDRFVADQGGADRYFGDLGSIDTMDFRPSALGAIVNLATGVHGGAALGDLFSSIEYFFGSDTAGDNLVGDGFNNRFDGYGGADILLGAGGTDTLNGGNGDDEISGGSGLDFLRGDAGADDFNYSALSNSGPTSAARDRILDFVAGLDDIDVTSIDAIAATGANDAFTTFLGSGAFTAEGQIRAFQSGANTVIEFNTTGASGAEMQIQLNNFTAATLTFGDFIA